MARLITFKDKTQSVKAWAEEQGITYISLRSRLSLGWSIERALTTPTRRYEETERRERGDPAKNGRFTILEATDQRDGNYIIYLCRCNNCGSEVMVPGNELANTISNHPLYQTWLNIISRCENHRDLGYHYYGGRGIRVCGRWRNSFIDFALDMGTKPSSRHSIERINNDGNYESCNCRWATSKQQMRNRSNNIMIEYHGKTQCLADWAIELGILYVTLNSRYHAGWSVERMMSKVRPHKKSY